MAEAEPKPGTIAYMAAQGGAPGQAYRRFIESIYTDEALSPKVRELIFIGVQCALDLEDSLRAHIPRAIAAGATKEEIAAAMMVSVANGGVSGALKGLTLIK